MIFKMRFDMPGVVSVILLLLPGLSCQADQMIVPPPPVLGASSYILMDFHSGAVITEKNADERLDPASLTKLMTGYLVYEALEKGSIRIDEEVEVSERAWKTEGSRMFIEVGSKVTMNDLLMGMVVQSGNDASVALAEHVAGSELTFVSLMNRKAKELGMVSSNFTNAAGLPSPDHQMTARDIALLSRALIRDFPEYYRMYSVKGFTYDGIKQPNRNRLLWRDPSVDGLKTGYTENAGYCLAASASREGMRLITVLLGSKARKLRFTQTEKLLDYGFRFFSTQRLYGAMQPIGEVRVWGGDSKFLQVGLLEGFYATFPRGMKDKVNIETRLVEEIAAPIEKLQVLGLIRISYAGSDRQEQLSTGEGNASGLISSYAGFDRQEQLLALTNVPYGTFVDRVYDWFLKLF